ncbi:isocitrate lyase/PEP mutase family protein [Taklimakanibacter deserti]|uniref:isocitrate lyase/PEP mutase family protein n=1 Tax=Taklimakanibacter deserti TaxID=2267839 RepID=UPI000E65464E
MTDQTRKAEEFHALHRAGNPLILFNIWDAGSAKAVAAAGARALATGSWSVANAQGFADGEHLPLAVAIDNLRRIVKVTDLPVTVDLESGYGDTPAKVGETIGMAIEAGAIGCNLEDSFPADGTLRPATDQVERIRAARRAADAAHLPFFINARTDIFFQHEPEAHDDAMIDAALERGRAYAQAGASGLFAPGLDKIALIERLAKTSSLPLNIMVGTTTPSRDELAHAGVARLSHGPGPYLLAMKALEDAARGAHL